MTLKEIENKIAHKKEEYKRNKNVLRKILNLIDLTTLEGTDNRERVENLAKKALGFRNDEKFIPTTAAICIYPNLIEYAKPILDGTNVAIAVVAGAFPSGQSPLFIRVMEVEYAVKNGAQDVDMVISRGRFLEGDLEYVDNEIRQIKQACGKAHLKVILETGELQSEENIVKAAEIAVNAGADFIKTSTGKIQPAATVESVYYMCGVIKSYYQKTGKKVGIKPAGGIADIDTAVAHYIVIEEMLGQEWLNNSLFRIGASRLADKIYNEIIN